MVNIGYAWCKREQLTPINIEHSPPPPLCSLLQTHIMTLKPSLPHLVAPSNPINRQLWQGIIYSFLLPPETRVFPARGMVGGEGGRGDPPLTIYLLISPVYSPTNFLSPHPKLIFPTTPLNKNLHAITW